MCSYNLVQNLKRSSYSLPVSRFLTLYSCMMMIFKHSLIRGAAPMARQSGSLLTACSVSPLHRVSWGSYLVYVRMFPVTWGTALIAKCHCLLTVPHHFSCSKPEFNVFSWFSLWGLAFFHHYLFNLPFHFIPFPYVLFLSNLFESHFSKCDYTSSYYITIAHTSVYFTWFYCYCYHLYYV